MTTRYYDEKEVREVIKVLRKARARVNKGWIKNRPVVEDPVTRQSSFCAIGAIDDYFDERVSKCRNPDFLYFDGLELRVGRALHYVLRKKYKKKYNSVVEFNDVPETKKEDVLALFDDAITFLKGRLEAAVCDNS